tara:strand:- start:727 stop:1533 length:807 start_codon:yes stop_codon:yes gene_type:complete
MDKKIKPSKKIYNKKVPPKTVLKKAGQYAKIGGKYALRGLMFINPWARVGGLVYKAGRFLYLKHQARNIGFITKRVGDITRTKTVLAPKRLKLTGKVVQAKVGTKYIGLTRPIATEVKRPKTIRLLPHYVNLPGYKMKLLNIADKTKALPYTTQRVVDHSKVGGTVLTTTSKITSVIKPTVKGALSRIARLRRLRDLKKEAAVGMGIKVGIGTGAIAGIHKMTQPNETSLRQKRKKTAEQINEESKIITGPGIPRGMTEKKLREMLGR